MKSTTKISTAVSNRSTTPSIWNLKTVGALAIAAASGYLFFKSSWFPYFKSYASNEIVNNPSIPDLQFIGRSWVSASKETDQQFEHLIDEYSLISYNILAQMYVNPDLSTHLQNTEHFPQILNWENRKELILQELESYAADFIHLQEVQNTHWENFLSSLNQRVSSQHIFYKGIYAEKPATNSFEIKVKENNPSLKIKRIGTALLYNSLKWTCLDSKIVSFESLLNDNTMIDVVAFNSMLEQFPELGYMKRENSHTVTMALMEHLQNKNKVLLVNTHLQWNPEFAPLKLFQHVLLCKQVEQFLKLKNLWNKETKSPLIALVISGDFNSLPSSTGYEYMTQGGVPFDSTSEELRTNKDFIHVMRYLDFSTNPLQSLVSAYHCRNEPLSNITPNFEGCLDYIYFKNIKVNKVLEELPKDHSILQQYKYLPNYHCPSDHTCLGIRFSL